MKQAAWETIGIDNDFMFGKVMRNPALCQRLLETILDIQIDHIEYPEGQKTIDLARDAHGVRLDVYVSDGEGTVFDVEMQALQTGGLPRRARYYQGMLDLNLIEKGASYKELKESYVIFICTFDMFGKGRHKYTFENLCREEKGLRLDDGAVKIFLNAAGTADDVNENLEAFLEYVAGKKNDNEFVAELDAEVARVRENKEWRRDYMTLLMRDQENIERGIQQGKLQMLVSLVKEGILPLEEASKRAGLSTTEFSEKMETMQ